MRRLLISAKLPECTTDAVAVVVVAVLFGDTASTIAGIFRSLLLLYVWHIFVKSGGFMCNELRSFVLLLLILLLAGRLLVTLLPTAECLLKSGFCTYKLCAFFGTIDLPCDTLLFPASATVDCNAFVRNHDAGTLALLSSSRATIPFVAAYADEDGDEHDDDDAATVAVVVVVVVLWPSCFNRASSNNSSRGVSSITSSDSLPSSSSSSLTLAGRSGCLPLINIAFITFTYGT